MAQMKKVNALVIAFVWCFEERARQTHLMSLGWPIFCLLLLKSTLILLLVHCYRPEAWLVGRCLMRLPIWALHFGDQVFRGIWCCWLLCLTMIAAVRISQHFSTLSVRTTKAFRWKAWPLLDEIAVQCYHGNASAKSMLPGSSRALELQVIEEEAVSAWFDAENAMNYIKHSEVI